MNKNNLILYREKEPKIWAMHAPAKHYPGSHRFQIRPFYLNIKGKSHTTMQGCVELLIC